MAWESVDPTPRDEHGDRIGGDADPGGGLPGVLQDPAVAGLRSAIDRLVAERPSGGDGGRVVALVQQLHRLQAVVDAATADFTISGEWAADGARSAATWLAERCRMPKAVAKRSVGLGKAADDLPAAADAWMAGDIGPAHMAALAAFRRPAPLLTVLVDYPTLHGRVCELADGTVLTPGQLLPWVTEADVERAVFGPGARVEAGDTSRFFRGATRRAIEIRDRTCTHPMCDDPAMWCEIDHVVAWGAGGRTTEQNGRLLCRFHHRMRQGQPPPGAG